MAEGGSETAIAHSAGLKAAQGVKPAAVPHITLGYLDQLGTAEISQRAFNATSAAAKFLGWKVAHCDAQGVPAQMTACANTLLNEHVNAIISTAMDGSLFTAQLKRAQAEHIPWVSTEDFVRNASGFTQQITPNDTAMGAMITDYMINKLKTLPASRRTVGLQTYTEIYGVQDRQNALMAGIKSCACGIKVVAVHQANLANAIPDNVTSVTAWLKEFPHLGAIWTDINYQVIGTSQAYRQAGLAGKSFPDRPLLTGFFGDKGNLQAIQNGLADAIVELPLEVNGYAAVDQIAGYLADHTPMKNTMTPGSYPINLAPPVVITKSNLPPAGQYVKPKADYVTFFHTKWKTEFTNVK